MANLNFKIVKLCHLNVCYVVTLMGCKNAMRCVEGGRDVVMMKSWQGSSGSANLDKSLLWF